MAFDEPVSDTDAKLLKKFGGVELVMVIIFTITFVLLAVILIKRQILRMLLISKRGPHTPVGTSAPQPLAREIEIRLRKIARLRIEPRMMAEQFNKASEDTSEFDSPPDQYARSYKYRLKAMDKMTELDDLICSINNKYGRRKGQSVRGYLRMLQKNPFNVVKGGDDTIDKLAEMYEHARYEPKEFGNVQYGKFAYLVEQMKDRVRLYINVPGSLIINTSSKQPKKPPLSSTKVNAQSTEIKPEGTEQQNDDQTKDLPPQTPEKTEEHDIEGDETDDVNRPLLPQEDIMSETTKDSSDTVIMVHRGSVNAPTTSGLNEENL